MIMIMSSVDDKQGTAFLSPKGILVNWYKPPSASKAV